MTGNGLMWANTVGLNVGWNPNGGAGTAQGWVAGLNAEDYGGYNDWTLANPGKNCSALSAVQEDVLDPLYPLRGNLTLLIFSGTPDHALDVSGASGPPSSLDTGYIRSWAVARVNGTKTRRPTASWASVMRWRYVR